MIVSGSPKRFRVKGLGGHDLEDRGAGKQDDKYLSVSGLGFRGLGI